MAGGYGPGDIVRVDVEGEGDDSQITFERIPAPEEEGEGEDSDGGQTKALPPPPA